MKDFIVIAAATLGVVILIGIKLLAHGAEFNGAEFNGDYYDPMRDGRECPQEPGQGN